MMPCVLRIYHGGDTWRVGTQRTPSEICGGMKKSWRQGGFGALLIFLESGFWVKKNDGAVIILTKVFDNMRKVKYMVMQFFFGQANRQIMWGILEPLGHTNYGRDLFHTESVLQGQGYRVVPVPKIIWKEDEMMVQWVLWKSNPKLWRFTLQGINIFTW